MEQKMLDETLNIFAKNTLSPEIYLQSQPNKAQDFKALTKILYDGVWSKSTAFSSTKPKSLPKLITENFDEEQIWQQLELQNNYIFPCFAKKVSNLKLNGVSFGIDIKDTNIEHVNEDSTHRILPSEAVDNYADSSSGNEGYAFDGDSDSSVDQHSSQPADRKLRSPERKSELSGRKTESPERKVQSKFATPVDDQFFKLSKLEHFLKLEDLKEGRGEPEPEDSDDEEIDLFDDIPSDDMDCENSESEEDETKETESKSSRNLMYEDFFDPPESGDENIDEHEFSDNEVNNNDYNAEENDLHASSNVKHDEETSNKLTIEKTAFQIEQEKIKRQIDACEKRMLEPLPWHLTGEVDVTKRPQNSLLYQETEFDSNTRQELVVDETLTEKTENIIKMAIINKAWNDVERKVKSNDELLTYKRTEDIQQTKSKKSLAEVYEEDYLKKKEKTAEEEDPKHIEIKKLMDSLFPQLHALFSHIPKPPVPEIKIVTNLRAVTVEEVAPTSMSDANLLAPREVKQQSGLVKGQTERTDTDRKRERRKKKMMQKFKQKESEAKEKSRTKPLTGKAKRIEKLEALKKLKRNKNTTIADFDSGQKIKSSKDFFSRLQDTVNAHVSQKVETKSPKKSKLKSKKKG